MRSFLFLFGFILFVSLVFSISSNPIFNTWVPLAFLFILISFFIIGIMYVVGTAFSMPSVIAWTKDELHQTVASGLLLVFCIGLFPFAEVMYSSLDVVRGRAVNQFGHPIDYTPVTRPDGSVGPRWSVFDEARAYLASRATIISRNYAFLFGEYSWIAMLAGSSINLRFGLGGSNVNVFQFYKVVIDIITLILKVLSGSFALFITQAYMLSIVESRFVPILLPIGLGLRCFTLTRKIGSAFIALALGFYLFYPVLFIMNDIVTRDYFENTPSLCRFTSPSYDSSPAAALTGTHGGYLKEVLENTFGATIGSLVGTSFLSFLLFKTKLKGMLFATVVWGLAFYYFTHGIIIPSPSEILIMLREMFYCPAYLAVVVCTLLPMLNIFLVLSIVRNIALVLGSDINLRTLTKFI